MLSLEKIKVRALTPREPKMILPLILTTHLWLTTTPTAFGIELLNSTRFKQSAAFLPTVDQAKSIRFEYGWSPEPRRLNRHERLAIKLSALKISE